MLHVACCMLRGTWYVVLVDVLVFRIPTTVDLAHIFTTMSAKQQYEISEWSIDQTSLEDVFMRIVQDTEPIAQDAATAHV
jgi:hypothetical protein